MGTSTWDLSLAHQKRLIITLFNQRDQAYLESKRALKLWIYSSCLCCKCNNCTKWGFQWKQLGVLSGGNLAPGQQQQGNQLPSRQAGAALLLFAPTLALACLLRLTQRTVPFFASVGLGVQAVQEVFQIGLTEAIKFCQQTDMLNPNHLLSISRKLSTAFYN